MTEWTKTLPTVAGYYWGRNRNGDVFLARVNPHSIGGPRITCEGLAIWATYAGDFEWWPVRIEDPLVATANQPDNGRPTVSDDDIQLSDEWLEAAGGIRDGAFWRFKRDPATVQDREPEELYAWLLVTADAPPIYGQTLPYRPGRIMVETLNFKPFIMAPRGSLVTRGQFRDVCRVLKFLYTEPQS